MSLTEKDIEKLDWRSEHEATLETHEVLEVLAKIAEDPKAYTEAEFDAGYTRAEQLANALRGMMRGLRAAEIAKTFKRAVKAREACEKYDLVPRAALEHAQTQLCAAGAMNIAIEARVAAMVPKTDPIGPNANAMLQEYISIDELKERVQDVLRPFMVSIRDARMINGEFARQSIDLISERIDSVFADLDAKEPKPASIGPGDPLPPPPPPTKALEPWTVDRLKLVFDERDMLFDMEDDAAELVVELIKNNGGAANERVGTKAP